MKIDAKHVQQEVTNAFAFALESFGFEHIVDNTDTLTDEEKAWAKENLDWGIVQLDGELL